MALNIKDSLEIVKRAGYGSRDIITAGKSERRMADSQRTNEEEPWLCEEQTDSIQSDNKDPLDETLEEIDCHRDPEKVTFAQLLDINDL